MIFIDDEQDRGDLDGRWHLVSFLERAGAYWRPPADDDVAIAELERMRLDGAEFFVVPWPAFWWTQQYPRLLRRLAEGFRLVLNDQVVVGYDLRRVANGSSEGVAALVPWAESDRD